MATTFTILTDCRVKKPLPFPTHLRMLTFNGLRGETVMRHTVKNFAKRFGIPVNDTIKGADIPALVAAREWEKIAAHVRSDVELTVALARKLGVLPAIVEPAEVL